MLYANCRRIWLILSRHKHLHEHERRRVRILCQLKQISSFVTNERATMFSTLVPDIVLASFCNRGHPFEGSCVSSCSLKCLRICSLKAERGITSLRDPEVWSCALSLPCHVKEAVCQLDILENGSWKKEICNSIQTSKSENKQNIKNRSSCVL